jgi:formate transporter
MAFAGHSVTDKAVAIVLPISAFVAAGFEHCVANMYFLPMGMLVAPQAGIDLAGYFANLVPVVLGNLVGGSGFIALVCYVIYVRGRDDLA